MVKTIFERVKEMKEEWIQFKGDIVSITSKTVEALNNANKTMDEINKTLDTIQVTLDDYGKFIRTLQDDYVRLRQKVDGLVSTKPKKPWWMPW